MAGKKKKGEREKIEERKIPTSAEHRKREKKAEVLVTVEKRKT